MIGRVFKTPLSAALVATMLLAGLLSGAAGATEHDIEFRGCRTIGGNIIKVTRSDEPDRLCRPWQPVVTWSQTGPAGPPGPDGADGADGADGVSGYVRVSDVGSMGPAVAGSQFAWVVVCPAGTKVFGGGADLLGTPPSWALQESYPNSDTQWNVLWVAIASSTSTDFTAWAICAAA